VASRTRTTFSWSETARVRDVVKEVSGLEQRFSREVQVHESCGLAQTLIEKDLIDEYRLLTFRETYAKDYDFPNVQRSS
jgi:dihydrofolate reductase